MKRKHLILTVLCLPLVTMSAQQAKYLDPKVPIEERIDDALSRMTTHEKVAVVHAQSKFTSAGVPRLGIRQLNMDDGPHGVRAELEWNSWNSARWTNDSCVAFPSLTCLAATWNRELAAVYGNAISEEFAYRGKDMILGPGADMARTPLNGRAFEYMGEDPFLAGTMVVPYIQAAQKNGVACCLKHFVLNDQETDRMRINVNVSERAMREIYLRPFEIAVKQAHVWSIMGSYNRWQNTHCCHNDALLNGILKKEWGWDGVLVSDWGGTHDTQQAVFGGLDIEMGTERRGPGGRPFTYDDYYLGSAFEQMIAEGKAPMSVLDDKVRRVLRVIFRSAMNPAKTVGSLCSEAHYDACRAIAEEGIVLLKNSPVAPAKAKGEALLPLTPAKLAALKASVPSSAAGGLRILVVGENATRSLTLGGGSSELKTLRDSAPLDAIKAAFGGSDAVASVTYAQGYSSGGALYGREDKVDETTSKKLFDEAVAAARASDLIIFVGGLNKNHRQDCEGGDREGYDLSFGQNKLISELAAIQPRTIVCLFGGNAYATPWLSQVPALLHCWYLGSESGTALAEVLSGQVCPSGKLPVTFANRLEDYPSMQFGAEGYPGVDRQVYYKEGIFVGYRWFGLTAKERAAVLREQGISAAPKAVLNAAPTFPFGFGLSYTTFKYDKPTVAATADGWTVTVAVSNTGSCAGKEIVQLYVAAPNNQALPMPASELRAYGKTRVLQPGESQMLSLHITPRDLASWDEARHSWFSGSGTYTLLVGASSTDIRGKATVSLPTESVFK